MTVQLLTRDNLYVEATWLDAYQVINQANTVLANLDKADNADDKTRWEGKLNLLEV